MVNTPIQIAVAVAPKVTGFISLLASSFLTHYVGSSKERRLKLVNRIILGLSISDVVFSFAVAFLSTWPVPSNTASNLVFGAAGNRATCRAQGFVDQWSGRSSYVYNAVLSIYYVLVVRFGIKEAMLKRWEWLMHLPPLLVGLGTAITILSTDTIHYTGGWTCWISDFPLNCSQTEGVTCQAGQNALLYRLWFNSVPLWICEIIITVAMLLIFLTVYKFEHASAKYSQALAGGESHKQSRRTARQAFLYTFAFYVTWFFTTFRIIEGLVHGHNPSGNVTFFLEALLLPLQGFWNCVIFLRPRYQQLRAREGLTRMQALCRLASPARSIPSSTRPNSS
mmetsp:Transcript_37907/g.56733  ORF Transcript_37907/g.56733 Transcript_37907/m.56733 type:complete len:337 (+) Transcript_37907:360-1370(+)